MLLIGSVELFNVLVHFTKGLSSDQSSIKLGWDSADLYRPRASLLKDSTIPINMGLKYLKDFNMEKLISPDLTIMTKVKPANSSSIIFSYHGEEGRNNHLQLLLEKSQLMLLFKDSKLNLDVAISHRDWTELSIEINTIGDCSVIGECCIIVRTYISNMLQSIKKTCVHVTDQQTKQPTYITIGKVG